MTRSVRVVLEDVDLGVSFVTANASLVPRPSPLPAGPYFARSFNSNVVVAMVVLILAIVVGAFVSTVMRVMRRWRRQRQRESPPPPPQQQVELAAKGLDPRAIEALPVVAYGAAAADDDDNVECVVCLSEFVHGEKLRMLPECHHAFHVACIDAWLVTHKTCPVCRQSLVTRSATVDVEPENSHSSRSVRSHFPSETVAILVHSALGSRRFGLRSQGG